MHPFIKYFIKGEGRVSYALIMEYLWSLTQNTSCMHLNMATKPKQQIHAHDEFVYYSSNK